MRIHVSNDMGCGGYGLLCAGLLVSITIEDRPCIACLQVSAVSVMSAVGHGTGILFSR